MYEPVLSPIEYTPYHPIHPTRPPPPHSLETLPPPAPEAWGGGGAGIGITASIDSVLFTMDVLVKIFETALTRHVSDSALTSRIRNSWQTFDKYYSKTDKSPLYAAALILYPNYRIAYIEVNWKKKWIKPALKKVTKLWESYREKTAVSITVSPQSKVSERDSEPDEFD